LGHYSWDLPENKNTARNSKGNKPNPFKKRHMNYVNMEEVFEVPNAANCKFDKLISNTCAFLLLWCTSCIHTKEIQGAMDKVKIHLIW
jgi:hypothetical protein